jgi:hypothetical protein
MAVGVEKMEREKTMWEKANESEAVFDDEDLEEIFWKENEEPPDLADQAYKQWQDEKRPDERPPWVIHRAFCA